MRSENGGEPAIVRTSGAQHGRSRTADRTWLARTGRALAWFTIGWNAIEGAAGIARASSQGRAGGLRGRRVRRGLRRRGHSVEAGQGASRRGGVGGSGAPGGGLIAGTFFALAVGIGAESLPSSSPPNHPTRAGSGSAWRSSRSWSCRCSLVPSGVSASGRAAVPSSRTPPRRPCACGLSAILLVGLGLNAWAGWWWADPLAALGIVYVATRKGLEHWRGEELDACC